MSSPSDHNPPLAHDELLTGMSAARFFYPDSLAQLVAAAGENGVCVLPAAISHHAVQVRRLGVAQSLRLFDGTGGEYHATIVDISGGGRRGTPEVRVKLGRHDPIERESPLYSVLLQALQGGDKMDFTLQKATELGVNVIVPVLSERSVLRLKGERADKRLAHWQNVIIAAAEQCQRNRLPQLLPLCSLNEALAGSALPDANTAQHRLLLAPHAATPLRELAPVAAVSLLVGGEGGFSADEAASALAAGFRGLKLGQRILRTETAALAALAALQARWGDFL